MITCANDGRHGQPTDDIMVNAVSRPRRLRGRLWAIIAAMICLARAASPAAGQSANQQPSLDALEHCRAIPDEKLRLRCYESMTSSAAGRPDQHPSAGGWRLVRTKNPVDQHEVSSITHTADDPELKLGGLELRCGSGQSLQILLFLIEPFPPRAHPEVILSAGPTKMTFAASVLPGGIWISLPAEASALAEGPWLSAPELKVSVQDQGSQIQGVIPLQGLASALQLLRSNCLAR
jgi:hypothetical protein